MSINHHLLAKTTTESILSMFKTQSWKSVNNSGVNFRRGGCQSTFPSPDAAFKDDPNKLLISFEFKPPTETKRGILTGLGQSIAYLKFSNLSYLVIPESIEGYRIDSYMKDLFQNQIAQNLSVGLISFENNNPQNVKLLHNVTSVNIPTNTNTIINDRFWAKHQDLPIPLFHLLLHCAYLKKIGMTDDDPFSYCWDKYMLPIKNRSNLKTASVVDINGGPIWTVAGSKKMVFGEKTINKIIMLSGNSKIIAKQKFLKEYSSSHKGDGGSMSVRKYIMAFMKHVDVIDSDNNLTEFGFKLYHLGMINGPTSKLFVDYFTKCILLTGHHLDLIFDLEELSKEYSGSKSYWQIQELLINDYETRGMMKKNPNRIAGQKNTVGFFKYEDILWNSLGLKQKKSGKPEVGFNWKRITEVCSMPDL